MICAAAGLLQVSGCAGSKPVEPAPAASFSVSTEAGSVTQLWSRKMPGLISDLNVALDGNSLLVTTIPDPEKGFRQHLLSRLDSKGKTVWSLPLSAQVKSQSIADDGSLAVISNYSEEVMGIDAKGQVIWKAVAACKPTILTSLKKILCYHDDDAAPGVAFEVLGWDGKKLQTYPSKNDVLSLKVSQDQSHFVLGMTRGQLAYFDSAFKLVWQKKVGGEILDVSVSSGSNPEAAVLYNNRREGQRLAIFDSQGKLIGEGAPSSHVEQVEISPSGGEALVYGNGPKGQYLALFSAAGGSAEATAARKTPAALREKWRRGDAKSADYSSSMIATHDLAIIGFEDIAPNTRRSRLLAFDLQGGLKWSIPLVTEEGAYLYAQSFSPEKSFLGVGTDDGNLSAYQVTSKVPAQAAAEPRK